MSGEMEPEHMRKVFIGGLHPDTTDESLRGYFSKYGEIVDCIVMRDSQTRRSRGFGFVAFDRSTCVDQLQNERPHHLDGKEVDTKRVVPKQTTTSQPRSDREQKVNKVFIGGLKDEISDEDIRQFFGQFGIVERLETFTDKETNRRKGFAFVTFQDFDSADKCVLSAQTNPDGKMNLQGYKVEVKKAKSQDEMKGGRGGGMRGGGRGGGRGGFGGGRGGGGYGDFNQGYNQGGYGGGYNQSNGGGYSGGGGYNQGGYGGGGDGYQGGYNNGGGGGWGGNQGGGQQGGGGGWGNGGGYGGGQQGGMGGGGYGGGAGGGGYGGGHQGGMGGGGPMRGGYNKGNRSTPYGGGGGGGGGGWRN